MHLARTWITHALIATMLVIQLAWAYRGITRRRRVLPGLAANPHLRVRFYLALILSGFTLAAFVPVILLVSPDLSPADIGWTWPNGDGVGYLLAAYLLVVMVGGGLRARYRMRRGHAHKLTAALAAMVPRTPRERRFAAALALSAGVCEEVVFRGLLIGAGSRLYHLPVAVASLVALALFVAGHLYQRRRGMYGIAAVGALYTLIYLMSGSVLLTIALHLCQDLVTLLLVPAYPTVPAREYPVGSAPAPILRSAFPD